jgi:hypothetical protein
MRMAQANANPNNQPFKVNIVQKEFELDYPENVTVKKLFLGTEYDDQGNVKQPTKAQRDAVSSGKGIAAKLEDLQAGQEVTVNLKKPPTKSSATKTSDTKKTEGALKADEEKKVEEPKKGEEKAVGLQQDAPAHTDRPIITTVYMTKEMPADAASKLPQAPKKKKNN